MKFEGIICMSEEYDEIISKLSELELNAVSCRLADAIRKKEIELMEKYGTSATSGTTE